MHWMTSMEWIDLGLQLNVSQWQSGLFQNPLCSRYPEEVPQTEVFMTNWRNNYAIITQE